MAIWEKCSNAIVFSLLIGQHVNDRASKKVAQGSRTSCDQIVIDNKYPLNSSGDAGKELTENVYCGHAQRSEVGVRGI